MGWTDLFKSKSARQNPDPQIRWFGKLPTYADYYSSKADEAWAVEFNDWVLKGYERFIGRLKALRAEAEPDAPRPDRRLEPSGCIMRMPESGMTVFVSIQDFGGDMRGRPFPLCMYAGLPTVQWPGPSGDRVLSALRTVRDLTALRHDVVRFFKTPGRFDSVFEGRQVDLSGINGQTREDSWVTEASAVSLSDWYAQAQPSRDGADLQSWARSVNRSGRSIATLDSEDFEASLCFPLSGELAWDVQTAGWIRWLESYMDLSDRYLSLMQVGDPDDGVGRLVVMVRKAISEEDFLLLTPVWRSLSYVDDLIGAGSAGSAAPTGEGPAGETGGLSSSASWGDFVMSRASVS